MFTYGACGFPTIAPYSWFSMTMTKIWRKAGTGEAAEAAGDDDPSAAAVSAIAPRTDRAVEGRRRRRAAVWEVIIAAVSLATVGSSPASHGGLPRLSLATARLDRRRGPTEPGPSGRAGLGRDDRPCPPVPCARRLR